MVHATPLARSIVVSSRFVDTITAEDRQQRDASLESLCEGLTLEQLLHECETLDNFRRHCDNLYERVYAGSGRLVLDSVTEFQRNYRLS